MNLKNKNILLVGLAKTGVSTIKLLNKLEANIIVNDIKDKEKLKDILEAVSYTHLYHPDFRYKKGEELLKELEDFNNVLKENMIDIEVVIGNEIYYTKDLIKEIDELDLYTLNNSRYIYISYTHLCL